MTNTCAFLIVRITSLIVVLLPHNSSRDCDGMVVGFTTTFASSNPSHDEVYLMLCDKVCQ